MYCWNKFVHILYTLLALFTLAEFTLSGLHSIQISNRNTIFLLATTNKILQVTVILLIVIINSSMKDKTQNLTFLSNQRQPELFDWTFSRGKEKKMPLGSFVDRENVTCITNLTCYFIYYSFWTPKCLLRNHHESAMCPCGQEDQR